MWPMSRSWSKPAANSDSVVAAPAVTSVSDGSMRLAVATVRDHRQDPEEEEEETWQHRAAPNGATIARFQIPASRATPPQRGETVQTPSSCTNSSSRTPGKTGARNAAASAAAAASVQRTPNSGPRVNPFDSHLSHDTLHLPTFSPSVFSTVISPSQESQSSSGRFWSVDQLAMLFPAQISDDSPWKQETATSRLDPETEDKTQGAIDLYFSQHHKITSPDDAAAGAAATTTTTNNERSMAESELGGSPVLSNSRSKSSSAAATAAATTTTTSQPSSPSKVRLQPRSSSCNNSQQNVTVSVLDDVSKISGDHPTTTQSRKLRSSRWTQTELTLPPASLPPELEEVLSKWTTFTHDQVNVSASPIFASNLPTTTTLPPAKQTRSYSRIPNITMAAAAAQDSTADNNLSTSSTLRRKLFEEEEEEMMDDDLLPAVVSISPGTVLLTPTARGAPVPSPGHGLTWSLSPVSRHKKKREEEDDVVGPPIESSTPTKN